MRRPTRREASASAIYAQPHSRGSGPQRASAAAFHSDSWLLLHSMEGREKKGQGLIAHHGERESFPESLLYVSIHRASLCILASRSMTKTPAARARQSLISVMHRVVLLIPFQYHLCFAAFTSPAVQTAFVLFFSRSSDIGRERVCRLSLYS